MNATQILKTAAGEIGYTETPAHSNKTKYGEAYGWNGVAWCVMFVWWCFAQNKAQSLFYGGKKTASCGQLKKYAVENGLWVTDNYRAGDLVIFDFNGTSSQTDHIGIVESVYGDTLVTIEGNTSTSAKGSQANGGEVARKTRSVALVNGAYRPKYEKEDDYMTGEEIARELATFTDALPESAWSEKEGAWEKAKALGITDGNAPRSALTREQLFAILDRLGLLK